MESFKVIIAGGRDFTDYDLLCKKADYILQNKTNIEIVSGRCKTGADQLGEDYASDRGHILTPFEANWHHDGKAAGPIRNEKMAQYAEALIAFWDGKSRGTNDMITRATDHKLKILIVRY